MKNNNQPISGVLHYKAQAERYHLERLLPEPPINQLVDQFWFVSWDLAKGDCHEQQNLPDPNFHLLIEADTATILGPVTKKYCYAMTGHGHLIGVKFQLGALKSLLSQDAEFYLDKRINMSECFDISAQTLIYKLNQATCNQAKANILAEYLSTEYQAVECKLPKPLANLLSSDDKDSEFDTNALNSDLQTIRHLMEMIRHHSDIFTVKQLSEKSGKSVRYLQRIFKNYIGLPPKWLIRKYRLHRAVAMLDKGEASVVSIAADLNYTDQAHLIRDFKNMLNYTPNAYVNQLARKK